LGGPGDAVAAVVVNYNSRRHLEVCLTSLRADGVARLVVVDNGSSDGSEAVAGAGSAGLVWVPAGCNLGYGRAANLGAAQPAAASARYLLVCNPDLDVRPGAVAALVAALDRDPSLGVVGPRLCNPDGTLYPSARTFPDLLDAMGHGLLGMVAPRNRFTRRYRLLDWDHSGPAKVDWVSGACFLVRREAWDGVGGFDPAYFMYMEDVDLCWRIGRAGWGVGYQPEAEVVHTQGVSADLHPYRMLAAHHRSMWLFARRTTSGWRRLALPVVMIGLGARFVVTVLRRRLAGRGHGPAGPGEAAPTTGTPGRGPLP
jgi:N-acetylglucosaminyl-diphospho-decaprenol L-rhamnosyltransferase